MSIQLGFYKIYNDVILPEFATDGSACFDIYSYLKFNDIKMFDDFNNEIKIDDLKKLFYQGDDKIVLHVPPRHRVLVSTGLIADIPKEHSIRLHARSGIALKRGLGLANSEGVIDSDYIDPIGIIIYNMTRTFVPIYHKERLVQGELIKSQSFNINEIYEKPIQKSVRNGGFGSTGTN